MLVLGWRHAAPQRPHGGACQGRLSAGKWTGASYFRRDPSRAAAAGARDAHGVGRRGVTGQRWHCDQGRRCVGFKGDTSCVDLDVRQGSARRRGQLQGSSQVEPFLLFLAALWIMAIAARSGVSGVNLSKVHAAYSLGANKWQVMRFVILPNSLPEIFTGARVAMGVCWGTVVAAELVAAEKGVGMMIMTASKFQQTDIVILGIVLIGIVGFGIDLLVRWLERVLVPWKGKG